jgi:hypothetical protein
MGPKKLYVNQKTPIEESYKIYQQGKKYEIATMILMERIQLEPAVTLPSYTTAGISIELYLKAILNHEVGEFPATHQLDALFQLLNPSTQHSILLKFNSFVKLVDGKQIKSVEIASGVKSSTDLFFNLKELSRAIVDMRYYFDMNYQLGVHMYFIDEIRRAIRSKTDQIFEEK